jgi:hypothetical protein
MVVMQKRTFAVGVLVAFAAPALICATPQSAERKSNVDPKLVIERFGGRELEHGLLIPVEVDGRALQFMLSSSDPGSTVDESIDVGSISSHRFMDTAGGALRRVDLYDTPRSSIGKIDLQQDLSVVQRQALKFEYPSAGYQYHGVLGCDFFRQHVVQIDFDQRELLILTDAPMDCGKSFELRCDSAGLPGLGLDVGGVTEDFCINTANVTFESGCIREELIRPLLEQGRARQVGATLAAMVDGQALTGVYQLDHVLLGRLSVHNAMFRVGPKNSISLKFLSRFLVTMDLANQRIYLKPGKQFEQADLYNRSGLSVCWHKDQMIVVNVEPFSPAGEADLRRGDILLSVGNVETTQLSLHSVQRTVRTEKDALPVVVHRGASEVLETVLHLAPALGEPLAAATTVEQRPTR